MRELPAIRRELHYGNRLVRCFADRPATVDEMFRAAVARGGQTTALVEGERRLSYDALETLVATQAAALLARGFRKGERMALLLGNSVEFVSLFLAAARIGLISVPLNTRQRMPEIRYVLEQNGTALLIADAACLAEVPPPGDLPALRGVFVAGDLPEGESALPEGMAPLAALTTQAPPAGPDSLPEPVAEEDVLCLLYTSGTTGHPKGAMLTHLSVIHSVLHFEWGLNLQEGDVAFLSVPASHVTGLVAILLPVIRVCGTSVLLQSFKARHFLETAEREGITYSLMVPAMYNLCLLDPEFARFDLRSWRVAGFGGAPMPEATITALAQALPGLVLQNVYGATETTSPATILPPGRIHDRAATVGIPLPLAEIVVVDEEGREVPPGTTGELLIAGPMVVPGYWDNPEGNAKGFAGGYWRSGDLGSVDAEGFVRVVDRRKDMINRGGFKIYSIEVENVLAACPGVIEAAVTGTPCPVLGERVRAFLWLGDATADAEEIRRYCAVRLSDYKVPDIITFLPGPLPRNANGKVQKTELRALG